MDGGETEDETNEALAGFGLVLEGAEAASDAPFRIYRCNWAALGVFCATWQQWRKVWLKDRLVRECIDWAQVESVLNLAGIKRTQWPRIYEGLKAAQDEALDYLNRDWA